MTEQNVKLSTYKYSSKKEIAWTLKSLDNKKSTVWARTDSLASAGAWGVAVREESVILTDPSAFTAMAVSGLCWSTLASRVWAVSVVVALVGICGRGCSSAAFSVAAAVGFSLAAVVGADSRCSLTSAGAPFGIWSGEVTVITGFSAPAGAT